MDSRVGGTFATLLKIKDEARAHAHKQTLETERGLESQLNGFLFMTRYQLSVARERQGV